MNKERIDKILGEDQPYPLVEVLKKLVWSAEYLLHNKDYDGPGYEEIEQSVKRGREIISHLLQPEDVKVDPNKVIKVPPRMVSESFKSKSTRKTIYLYSSEDRNGVVYGIYPSNQDYDWIKDYKHIAFEDEKAITLSKTMVKIDKHPSYCSNFTWH